MTITKRGVFALLAFLIPLVAFAPLAGSAGPILSLAQSFAVLSASKVTNTGRPKPNGDLGLSPSPKSSGFFGVAANEGPGKAATGTTHETDAVAAQAQNDALIAANVLSGLPFTSNLTGQGKVVTGTSHETDAVAAQAQNNVLAAADVLSGLLFTRHLTAQDLRGLTLAPSVHLLPSSPQLTRILTHDAQGRPSADFVQIEKTGSSASNSTVSGINGDAGDGVYWDDGSSASLDTTTPFAGDILAEESIALDADADILCSGAIARNAAVTTDSNRVSDDCTGAARDGEGRGLRDFGSLGFSSGASGDAQGRDVPEPSSCLLLLATGLIGVGARIKGILGASVESV